MKILVVSDTHGRAGNFFDVLEKHEDCKEVIFLGDGLGDLESIMPVFKDRNFTFVSGNCDRYFHSAPMQEYKCFCKKVLFITHGHLLNVKFKYDELIEKTVSVQGDIALFGHTHTPTNERDSRSGVYLFNPGSLAESRYGILEISEDGKKIEFNCKIL